MRSLARRACASELSLPPFLGFALFVPAGAAFLLPDESAGSGMRMKASVPARSTVEPASLSAPSTKRESDGTVDACTP